MNEQPEVREETLDSPEEVVEVEETQETEPTEEVDSKDWEAEARKAQELADNYKKRAEKAEKKAKEVPEAPKHELSNMDILAIAKADVHEDDIERVTKFAQMEGISVKDALGHDDVKAILERRAEARKVATASNTDSSKGSPAKRDGETLLEKSTASNMPNVEDLEAMWKAQDKR